MSIHHPFSVVYFHMCGYAPLKLFKAKEIPSLHHHISLLLNWKAIAYGLKKWRKRIKGN